MIYGADPAESHSDGGQPWPFDSQASLAPAGSLHPLVTSAFSYRYNLHCSRTPFTFAAMYNRCLISAIRRKHRSLVSALDFDERQQRHLGGNRGSLVGLGRVQAPSPPVVRCPDRGSTGPRKNWHGRPGELKQAACDDRVPGDRPCASKTLDCAVPWRPSSSPRGARGMRSAFRWTCRTTEQLAKTLTAQGHSICPRSVAKLLRHEGFELCNRRGPRRRGSDRAVNAKCRQVAARVNRFLGAGLPVIRVTLSEKELFRQSSGRTIGEAWTRPNGESHAIRRALRSASARIPARYESAILDHRGWVRRVRRPHAPGTGWPRHSCMVATNGSAPIPKRRTLLGCRRCHWNQSSAVRLLDAIASSGGTDNRKAAHHLRTPAGHAQVASDLAAPHHALRTAPSRLGPVMSSSRHRSHRSFSEPRDTGCQSDVAIVGARAYCCRRADDHAAWHVNQLA